jgi:hypothetical protein
VNPRDLLTRLLDYVEEQAKDIDPRAFKLANTKGFLKRRTDLAGLPGVEFDLDVEGDHLWLRVQRVQASKPPPLEEKVKRLIRVSDDPNGARPSIDEAAMKAHIVAAAAGKTPEEGVELERRGRATLEQALAQYTPLWEAWAEGEKPRRRSIDLYGELFAIKHQLEAEETANPTELVWGVGIATWQLKWYKAPDSVSKVDLEYPLLTQQMEVGLDEATMALYLRPRATDTRYEGDALAVCLGRGAADVERAARQQLERNQERPITPFDPGSFTDVLKLAAGNLDSHGTYQLLPDGDGAMPPPGEHLVVSDAWALFARPRSNNYLLDDLRQLKQRLVEGCDIPGGPAALVTIPSDEPVSFADILFRGLSSHGANRGSGKVRELYFPLPYNQEQVTIVQQLERADGVAVQGPPGTGKTHTIANIICHYLATGRRVLVTSKGEPALQVLQDKIPEEVRPLTVALLTGDRESLRQFESAINTIQARVSQLNPELSREQIEQCKSRIDRAHADLAAIDRRVDEIAQAQLAEVQVDGQPMRAQKLAELVVGGKDEYGWFDDEVTLAPEHAPPLSDEEAGRLREVRRKLGNDLVYVQARVPAADDLQPADVAQLHDVLVRMHEIEQQLGQGALPVLKATTTEVLEAARQLLVSIESARTVLTEIDELGEPWAHQVRLKCRLPSFQAERTALEALCDEITALTEARAAFLRRPVELPPEALASPKVHDAVQRATATGKPFGLMSFGNGDVKEAVARVKVAGLPPATLDDWRHVKRFLDLHVRIISFVTRWNQFAPALSAPKLEGGIAELRRIEVVASAARNAHLLATHHDVTLVRKAEEVFAQAPVRQLNGTSEELATVRAQLMTHLTRSDLAQLAQNPYSGDAISTT